MRRFRAYRFLRASFVIATVALRYFWLLRRDRGTRKPTAEQWERAHRKTGGAIYKLATELGGAFVKLGQILGARADVLPPALVGQLRTLHDRMPPRPLAKLTKHVEREMGKPIDAVFSHVEPTALAAASLAQVHRATLKSGEDVVIKIQYPEARRLFPIDLGSLRRAVRVARWLNGGIDLRPLANELAEFVTLELQFAREAQSTERVRNNLANDPSVAVPTIHHELSSDKILVLGFLSGTALTKREELVARGVDLRDVARRIATLYAKMIFEHGFFQGDPHPGNILVLDDGRIGLLDFGLAKELPPGFASAAATMIARGVAGDSQAAVAAARSIGFVIADDLAPDLVTLVRALLGDYRNATDLLQHFKPGKLEIPSHFTLIGRVMIILSGVSHMLVPNERVVAGAIMTALAPHLAAAQRAS
jgi:ubiquinone biosynthesis protein